MSRLTAQCGLCCGERRPQPGLLGTVEKLGDRLVWYAYDVRVAKGLRRVGHHRPRDQVPLSVWLDQAGDTIDAYCRHHGAGSVLTRDVIGKRGTIPVTFTATG